MTWLNYITNTSWNKHWVTIDKKYKWIHSKVTITSTDDTSEAVDVTLYWKIIGSLIYLTNTRPDICFVVNTLSQYMVNPKQVHLIGAKHVMRYLKVTLDYGLRYTFSGEIKLHENNLCIYIIFIYNLI